MIAVMTATVSIKAQDKVEANISADITSQYIWRGVECGQVSLQPTLGLAYKGLSLTAWGNVGLSVPEDVKEFDLTLGYEVGGFNVGITDYYFNTNPHYFNYKSEETSHMYEGFASYDFGVASIAWYTVFAGCDGTNGSDKRAYSSYFEANVPFRLAGLDWNATVGLVPYTSSLYGADGFSVTNIALKATKELHITDSFTLPVFAGINTNPESKQAHFLFGFTIQP